MGLTALAGAIPSAVVTHICATNPEALEATHSAVSVAGPPRRPQTTAGVIPGVAAAMTPIPNTHATFVYHNMVSGCSFSTAPGVAAAQGRRRPIEKSR